VPGENEHSGFKNMGPSKGSQKAKWRFPRKLVPIIDSISVINGNNRTKQTA
jgi:hypothetical protein